MAARNEVAIDLLARNMATRELDAAAKTLQSLGTTVQNTGKMASSASQIWTGAMLHIGESVKNFLFKGIALAGDSIIGFNSRVEQAMIGFTTMLGSGAKAQGFMEELQQFAASTPFEFDGLRQSANLIMAMGFEAKEVIPLLTAAGDAVAALGLGTEAVQRVVYALGQMRAAGRVTGQDMMQLSSMGIPAWKMLADSMGKTVQETKKLAEQGAIDAETAIAAITTAIEEGNMGGMMAAQAKTFNGAMSTIKDTIQIVVSQAFKPLFDEVSKTTVGISEFLGSSEFLAWADDAREALSGVIRSIMDMMASLEPVIEQLLPAMASAFGEILEIASRAFTGITIALGGVIALLGAFMPQILAVAPLLLTVAVAWKTASIAVGIYTAVMKTAAAQTAIIATFMTLKTLLGGLPLLFYGGAAGAKVFGSAVQAAMGPIGWITLGIGLLVTAMSMLNFDVGAEIDNLAMDFGDMGLAIDGLVEKTGQSRDEVKDSVTEMMKAYEFSFDEATYVMNTFGDSAGEMGDNVNGIMDAMGVSVERAGEMAKRFGEDWERETTAIKTATDTTGISWETMQARMAESYAFLSTTDQLNMMYAAADRGPEAWKALMDGYQGVDEATKKLGDEFALTKEQIDRSGTDIVQSVRQTTDGIQVTLKDGTILVGKSAEEVMQPIIDAANKARQDSLTAMSDLLTGLKGMFESDESVQEAFQGLMDRMDDPYTEAERKADVFSNNMLTLIKTALDSDDPGAVAASTEHVNRMLGEFALLEPGALESGRAVPPGMKKGMDQQMGALIAYIEKDLGIASLAAMEIDAVPPGLEAVASYARGMRANDIAATAAAQYVAMRGRDALYVDASAGGASVINSWVGGMSNAWWANLPTVWGFAAKARAAFGGSLPTEGPLKGGVASGGYSIIESWAQGMERALPLLESAVEGIAGSVAFGASTPGLSAGVAAGISPSYGAAGSEIMDFSGGGGGTTNITVVFDSTFPPTASQAQTVAQAFVPELIRELDRQGKR